MESQDQVLEGQSTETNHEAEDGAEKPVTVEVNGETVDIEELKKGYMRQSDYTRKTQELAREKKENSLTEEERNYIEFLKNNKFVTVDDLENIKKEQESNAKLEDLMSGNPSLKQFESAIKAIGKQSDMAWEDIIVKYGFSSGDKLQKAKSAGIVGDPKKDASVGTMSLEQYEEWRSKQGITGRGGFSKR